MAARNDTHTHCRQGKLMRRPAERLKRTLLKGKIKRWATLQQCSNSSSQTPRSECKNPLLQSTVEACSVCVHVVYDQLMGTDWMQQQQQAQQTKEEKIGSTVARAPIEQWWPAKNTLLNEKGSHRSTVVYKKVSQFESLCLQLWCSLLADSRVVLLSVLLLLLQSVFCVVLSSTATSGLLLPATEE